MISGSAFWATNFTAGDRPCSPQFRGCTSRKICPTRHPYHSPTAVYTVLIIPFLVSPVPFRNPLGACQSIRASTKASYSTTAKNTALQCHQNWEPLLISSPIAKVCWHRSSRIVRPRKKTAEFLIRTQHTLDKEYCHSHIINFLGSKYEAPKSKK